jgi:hypothetical protein
MNKLLSFVMSASLLTGCFYGRTPETRVRAAKYDTAALVVGIAIAGLAISQARGNAAGAGDAPGGLAMFGVGTATALSAIGGMVLNSIGQTEPPGDVSSPTP